jgi:hypothetical protein
MNLEPTLCEHPAPDAACAADPRIARAETWLCMLSGFLGLGLWLVRALTRQAAPGAHDPKWTGPRVAFPDRGNPITIFGRVARAVRLTIALRLKIEQEIADLLTGKSPSPIMPASEAPPTDLACDEEIAEVEDIEEVERLQDTKRPEAPPREVKAPLTESDRFHRLLNGPLKDAVAAICADLGLGPDWSLWTEDGFPPPPGGDVRVWEIFRSSETETPPPPDPDEEADGAAQIIWRPRWRRPRRSISKPPLDPRCDRGPAVWPDFNDYYFNELLKGKTDGL